MWAIRNKRTRKWVYGTWWQDGRVVQRTSDDRVMIFESYEDAKREYKHRKCGKCYELVPVRVDALE